MITEKSINVVVNPRGQINWTPFALEYDILESQVRRISRKLTQPQVDLVLAAFACEALCLPSIDEINIVTRHTSVVTALKQMLDMYQNNFAGFELTVSEIPGTSCEFSASVDLSLRNLSLKETAQVLNHKLFEIVNDQTEFDFIQEFITTIPSDQPFQTDNYELTDIGTLLCRLQFSLVLLDQYPRLKYVLDDYAAINEFASLVSKDYQAGQSTFGEVCAEYYLPYISDEGGIWFVPDNH